MQASPHTKGIIQSVLSVLTAAEFQFPLCLIEVYYCVKKGNLKQFTLFCSKRTLFIQTKCLKGRQSKDTTWQDFPLKAYPELYAQRPRGVSWWLKKSKSQSHFQKKARRSRWRTAGWLVSGEIMEYGFAKDKLCLIHLIASCVQDLSFWVKGKHMSFTLTSARLSSKSHTIFFYPC